MTERPPLPDALPLPVVDNHTHLDIGASSRDSWPEHAAVDSADAELSALLDDAVKVNVPRAVQVGCDLPSARWTADLVAREPRLVGAVALHPNEAPRLAAAGELAAAYDEIAALARRPRIRCIGETGLDYFRTEPSGQAVQQDSFRWHIALAKELDLTLQIHDRDAHEDVMRILAEEGAPRRTVFHCFSGDGVLARRAVEAGYYLSFAGTVTFKNAQNLRNALAVTPLDRLQVETDAPYLTPMPYRGRPNASYLVPHTVRAMAQTLAVDVPALCRALNATAEHLYGPWGED
ncbi:TatD family hydrolase [Angustibacter sp. McL0619]|uniref:TatD family hydrolase n=1 Tax=Angustibacter sp. McL0619 TaxID=3415676 RepID=UPI003CEFDAD9